MRCIWVLSTILLLNNRISGSISNRTFPKGFKFGAGSSAFQVEGGWNADGKGESKWDYLTHHNPQLIIDGSNADIACDSYHKYKDDVAILKELGVNFYRFSLAWSRILPTGLINDINQAGVTYYKNFIRELKAANIEPMITLYHWDLPQSLEYLGGFSNPLIIDYFVNYANLAFSLFGNDVKLWTTFNEPKSFCEEYPDGIGTYLIPNYPIGVMSYECTRNILLAHAKVYHLYHNEYNLKQKGKMSISLSFEWSEPASNSYKDSQAAERKRQFDFGWYANPIVYGNYPQVMIDQVARKSSIQGFPKSRLPKFTHSERKLIKGTYDFLAINHYSTWLVQWIQDATNDRPSFINDTNVKSFKNLEWQQSASSWLTVVPWGFRKLLNWVKDTYKNPEIVITESGYSDYGELVDTNRVNYYKEYLSELLEAIYVDKVKVTGYTAWSIMDNFEWINGYRARFGIYSVDFESPNRTRAPKESAKYYKKVIESRCLVDKC